jgi:hypothetical protein
MYRSTQTADHGIDIHIPVRDDTLGQIPFLYPGGMGWGRKFLHYLLYYIIL